MKLWQAFLLTAVILILGSIAYVTYQGTKSILEITTFNELRTDIETDGSLESSAETIKDQVVRSRKASAKHGGALLKSMLLDRLMHQTWHYPDESVATLREAIPLGIELYNNDDFKGERAKLLGYGDQRSRCGYLASWGMIYTGLPQKYLAWSQELLAQAPELRGELLPMQVEALLMLDDRSAARELLEEEELLRGNWFSTAETLMVGYTYLGDYERAIQYQAEVEGHDEPTEQGRWGLAMLHLNRGEFLAAERQLIEAMRERPEDAHFAFYRAVARIGHRDLSDSEVQRLLLLSTNTNRVPVTLAGQEAWACEMLYEVTGNPKHLDVLAEVKAANGDDFQVALAEVNALIDQWHWAIGSNEPTADTIKPAPAALVDPYPIAMELVTRANNERERRWAFELATLAALVPTTTGQPDPDAQARTLAAMRGVFGAPLDQSAQAVQLDAVADYTTILGDEYMLSARAANAEFDQAVHELIVDYLNARRALYTDVMNIAEIPVRPVGTS